MSFNQTVAVPDHEGLHRFPEDERSHGFLPMRLTSRVAASALLLILCWWVQVWPTLEDNDRASHRFSRPALRERVVLVMMGTSTVQPTYHAHLLVQPRQFLRAGRSRLGFRSTLHASAFPLVERRDQRFRNNVRQTVRNMVLDGLSQRLFDHSSLARHRQFFCSIVPPKPARYGRGGHRLSHQRAPHSFATAGGVRAGRNPRAQPCRDGTPGTHATTSSGKAGGTVRCASPVVHIHLTVQLRLCCERDANVTIR